MRLPPVLGRMAYKFVRPFLGLLISGKPRTRAMVICDFQILLVRNWKGRQRWTLPGGGVKNQETFQQGIVRELKEELDLEVAQKDLEHVSKIDHVEGSINFPVIVYRLDLSEKPSLSMRPSEVIDTKWFDVDGLPQNIDELSEQVIKQQR